MMLVYNDYDWPYSGSCAAVIPDSRETIQLVVADHHHADVIKSVLGQHNL